MSIAIAVIVITNAISEYLSSENVIINLLPKEEAYTKTTIIPPKNIITKEKKNHDKPE